ncbi:MAG: hypothetical protein WC205_00615 [Opitutaceae bacterium]|jgi:hypothetical protein
MSPSLHLSLVLGLLLTVSGASAAVSLDGLATHSPFMLQQEEEAAPTVTASAAVEFRGLISSKDGVFFGLYDRTRNTGAWVKKNDKSSDFQVRSYDEANDMVTLDYQGQKFTLALSSAKIGTAAPSPVVVAPPPGGPPVPGAPGAPVAAGARVDDQRRLESVAAEVRRRRALRQSGGTGQPGGSRR